MLELLGLFPSLLRNVLQRSLMSSSSEAISSVHLRSVLSSFQKADFWKHSIMRSFLLRRISVLPLFPTATAHIQRAKRKHLSRPLTTSQREWTEFLPRSLRQVIRASSYLTLRAARTRWTSSSLSSLTKSSASSPVLLPELCLLYRCNRLSASVL